MTEVKINGEKFMMPGSYNELAAWQVIAVCKVLLEGLEDLNFKVFSILAGVKPGLFFKSKLQKYFEKLPAGTVEYLAYDEAVTGWVFQPAKLHDYKIGRFSHKGTTYYGPPGDMVNISTAEMIEAMMYYSAYTDSVKSGEPKELLIDHLIAVLYRPSVLFHRYRKLSADFTLDRRKISNEYRFNKRVKRFAGLDPGLKLALLMQFEGALEKFSKNFPHAFSGRGSSSADANAWVKLLMNMSNDIFGTYEQTQKIDAFTFFSKVDANIEQYEKQQEKK